MTLDIRALSLSPPSFAPRLTTVNEVRGRRGEEEVARPPSLSWLPAACFRCHLVLFVRLGFNLVRTFFLSAEQ